MTASDLQLQMAEREILALATRLATAEREAFDERDSSGNQG